MIVCIRLLTVGSSQTVICHSFGQSRTMQCQWHKICRKIRSPGIHWIDAIFSDHFRSDGDLPVVPVWLWLFECDAVRKPSSILYNPGTYPSNRCHAKNQSNPHWRLFSCSSRLDSVECDPLHLVYFDRICIDHFGEFVFLEYTKNKQQQQVKYNIQHQTECRVWLRCPYDWKCCIPNRFLPIPGKNRHRPNRNCSGRPRFSQHCHQDCGTHPFDSVNPSGVHYHWCHYFYTIVVCFSQK